MVNLLPPEFKDRVRNEYRLRILSVGLFLFAIAIFINLVGSFPYFVDSSLSKDLAESKLQTVGQLSTTTDQIGTRLDLLKQEVDLLKPTAVSSTSPSVLIRQLIADKPAAVSLTGFSFSISDKSVGLTASGIAKTREDLSSFAAKLSSDPAFDKVDLPVSNFSKKSDIDFSINLTVYY